MADLIEWQSHLNLGIAPLDYQHRELADMLNLLVNARADPGQDHAALLQRIHRHARAHFLYEEKLMLSSGFPDHISHQREHTMLLAELKSLTSAIVAGRVPLDHELMSSLRHWFIAHLVTSDRAFATHFVKI
ncbi:MAG: bacteriohemerythrin, partial [Hydrogenophaga sp.]|uniref:bacteriohemerythrin n=1 Tax=Hydrogenophaga sp. TaxID=1904254 RepID=UPI002634CA6E